MYHVPFENKISVESEVNFIICVNQKLPYNLAIFIFLLLDFLKLSY